MGTAGNKQKREDKPKQFHRVRSATTDTEQDRKPGVGFPRHLNSAWHTVGVQNYLFSDWTCWVGRKTHRCPLRVGGGGHLRGGPGSSVQASRSVVSDSLRPRGRQRARPPCPSPTPRAYSNSCPRVGDAIQPSHPLVPFSSRLQSTAPGRGTSKAKKRKGK